MRDDERRRRARRRPPRAAASSAARSSPGRTSGSPRSARGAELASPPAEAAEQPRVCDGAARPGGERGAQRVEVVGGVDVEHERRRPRRRATARAGRRGQRARGARGCPAPNDGAIDLRRREQQRVRAGAVAVGDDRRPRAPAAGTVRASSASTSLGVERRAVAGDEQHALGARARPPGRRRAPRPRRGRRRPGSWTTSAPWPRASAVADGSPVTTTTSSTRLGRGAAR